MLRSTCHSHRILHLGQGFSALLQLDPGSILQNENPSCYRWQEWGSLHVVVASPAGEDLVVRVLCSTLRLWLCPRSLRCGFPQLCLAHSGCHKGKAVASVTQMEAKALRPFMALTHALDTFVTRLTLKTGHTMPWQPPSEESTPRTNVEPDKAFASPSCA